MHIFKTIPVLLAAFAQATPAEVESALERRADTWEAHAKYYALGGKTGSEIYIQGTWSSPAKVVGEDAGPCSARIGGIGGGDPFDVNCHCQITGDGPLRFTSTCFLDFSEEASDGSWAAGFSITFQCTAFNSCTGTNAYSISSSGSDCRNDSGSPCSGFRVTS